MEVRRVTLRTMTQAEYERACEARETESIRELSKWLPADEARRRTRAGTAQYLPDGLNTAGHQHVTAEDAAGQSVGNAWIGPDWRAASGTAENAWLYDINVFDPFRRQGYGSAILAAIEELVSGQGKSGLGLNVVGDNLAAIALYRSNGYIVSSMFMTKPFEPPDVAWKLNRGVYAHSNNDALATVATTIGGVVSGRSKPAK